jgi:quinol monooxygenase YgiN
MFNESENAGGRHMNPIRTGPAMSEPILYLDRSEVHEGKIEELKTAIKELAELVEAKEPRIISYNAYFTEDGTRMTVVHVHPDSASLEFHMKVAGSVFPKFAEFIKLLTIDVYGKPSDELVEQMRKKARMLGNGTVAVHKLHAGFAGFGVRAGEVEK